MDDKIDRLAKYNLWANDWCYVCAKYPCKFAREIEHDVAHGCGIQFGTKITTGFDGDHAVWDCRGFQSRQGIVR